MVGCLLVSGYDVEVGICQISATPAGRRDGGGGDQQDSAEGVGTAERSERGRHLRMSRACGVDIWAISVWEALGIEIWDLERRRTSRFLVVVSVGYARV